jgi:4-hydroxybenzoate polyprenyltransferase
MSSTIPTHRPTNRADLGRTIALTVSVVFLVVGVAGFIPGITTHYGDMQFAGHDSDAKLIGIFEVSVLHNIVHLALGVAGVAMSRTVSSAWLYLIGGGVVYAIIWIYGLIVDRESNANFVPLNSADNWLHFALAVLMIALGVWVKRVADRDDRTTLRH